MDYETSLPAPPCTGPWEPGWFPDLQPAWSPTQEVGSIWFVFEGHCTRPLFSHCGHGILVPVSAKCKPAVRRSKRLI